MNRKLILDGTFRYFKALGFCLFVSFSGFAGLMADESNLIEVSQVIPAVASYPVPLHPKSSKESMPDVILKGLTTDAQQIEHDIDEMVALFCCARLINVDEKLRHERIALFLKSLCIDIKTWLDVARGVTGKDQRAATLMIARKVQNLKSFIDVVREVLVDVTSVILACDQGCATIDDVHGTILNALIELVPSLKKTWHAMNNDESAQTVFCADSSALSYNLLAPRYQVSISTRWWSGSLLDRAFAIDKHADQKALLKKYHLLVSAITCALLDHNKLLLADQRSEITLLIELFELEKISVKSNMLGDIFDRAIFNLLALKASIESSLMAPNIVLYSEKTEAYAAHQHVLADQRFAKLYQAPVFRPYLKKYLTSLELYFALEEHDAPGVMYEVYDALYGISLLKTREEKGFFKKMVFGTPEYLVLLDQMHDVLKKAYKDLRTQLLPKPGFLQKLFGTDWLNKDKIKNFVCEKSGQAVVELAQKCVGQRFDTKESAMVYAMSVGAPLTLLAALKWLVPNLPQQLQNKVHEFVRVLPLAQDDDQKLAQLIRDNPEVVQAFLQQDQTLVESLEKALVSHS